MSEKSEELPPEAQNFVAPKTVTVEEPPEAQVETEPPPDTRAGKISLDQLAPADVETPSPDKPEARTRSPREQSILLGKHFLAEGFIQANYGGRGKLQEQRAANQEITLEAIMAGQIGTMPHEDPVRARQNFLDYTGTRLAQAEKSFKAFQAAPFNRVRRERGEQPSLANYREWLAGQCETILPQGSEAQSKRAELFTQIALLDLSPQSSKFFKDGLRAAAERRRQGLGALQADGTPWPFPSENFLDEYRQLPTRAGQAAETREYQEREPDRARARGWVDAGRSLLAERYKTFANNQELGQDELDQKILQGDATELGTSAREAGDKFVQFLGSEFDALGKSFETWQIVQNHQTPARNVETAADLRGYRSFLEQQIQRAEATIPALEAAKGAGSPDAKKQRQTSDEAKRFYALLQLGQEQGSNIFSDIRNPNRDAHPALERGLQTPDLFPASERVPFNPDWKRPGTPDQTILG